MNHREKLTKQLDIQAQHEGETENIKLVRRILDAAKTSSEFAALTYATHHRYGTQSYEAHVFHYVKPWFIELCNSLSGKGDQLSWSVDAKGNHVARGGEYLVSYIGPHYEARRAGYWLGDFTSEADAKAKCEKRERRAAEQRSQN